MKFEILSNNAMCKKPSWPKNVQKGKKTVVPPSVIQITVGIFRGGHAFVENMVENPHVTWDSRPGNSSECEKMQSILSSCYTIVPCIKI